MKRKFVIVICMLTLFGVLNSCSLANNQNTSDSDETQIQSNLFEVTQEVDMEYLSELQQESLQGTVDLNYETVRYTSYEEYWFGVLLTTDEQNYIGLPCKSGELMPVNKITWMERETFKKTVTWFYCTDGTMVRLTKLSDVGVSITENMTCSDYLKIVAPQFLDPESSAFRKIYETEMILADRTVSCVVREKNPSSIEVSFLYDGFFVRTLKHKTLYLDPSWYSDFSIETVVVSS